MNKRQIVQWLRREIDGHKARQDRMQKLYDTHPANPLSLSAQLIPLHRHYRDAYQKLLDGIAKDQLPNTV